MPGRNNFFAAFDEFNQQDELSLSENFNNLALTRNWKNGGKTYRKNKNKCYEAAVRDTYGASNKLAGWQDLCADLQIEPVPTSITQCKKAISRVHVNIFDFVDARSTGTTPKTFKSVGQLQQYSRKHSKVFPKQLAKEDGYLSALLRKIF